MIFSGSKKWHWYLFAITGIILISGLVFLICCWGNTGTFGTRVTDHAVTTRYSIPAGTWTGFPYENRTPFFGGRPEPSGTPRDSVDIRVPGVIPVNDSLQIQPGGNGRTGHISLPANLTAQDIAGKFVHQQDTLQDFSATVDVAMISYPNADRFQVQKKNPISYRLEYLQSGSEPRGTLIITDGSVIWWYSPLTKKVHRTTHFDPNETYFTQRDYQKMVRDLFEQHPHAFSLIRNNFSNNSYVVEFSAQPKDPFANIPGNYQNARVWIDMDTWIAKKIELYNDSGPAPVSVEYRDIRVNSSIAASQFILDPGNVPNPPMEFRHHDPVIFLFELKNAYNVQGSALVVPGYVPEGYAFSGGYQTWDGTIQLSLVNGKQSISYIDSPVIGKPYTEQLAVRTIEVALNRSVGIFREGTDKNQLEWIKNGHDYSLTGMVSEDEMVRMAKSLVHVDDQLMKILPQKGIQIAKPLTTDELTSLIMPESWIRSNNNSTTPGIIDIRMTASSFREMFVPNQKYPSFLVYRNTGAHERVALYQVPKTMFAVNNPDLNEVRLNHPESMFRYFPDLDAVWADRCKYDQIPCADKEVIPVE